MSACVEHTQKGRYARVRRNGRLVHLHVAVWEQAHGPKPDGYHVHHECCNKRCVLLAHLRAMPGREHRRLHAPLTMEVVRAIRAEYAALPRATRNPRQKLKTNRPVKVARGERRALREKYGLTHENFRHVIKGQTWQED